MRRRRLPGKRSRRGSQNALMARASTTDFRFLEQVVCIQFPVNAARAYLARNMANKISFRLVEAGRGEQVGQVRLVEVKHDNGGDRTFVRGVRLLANGEPASFYVPDHLVRIEPELEGVAAANRTLSVDDEIILHVPVRGYLRFLPAIFQGEGPVSARRITRTRDSALQRWGGVKAEASHIDVEFDEDPVRRFLFLFQHVMTSITDQIDRMADLTDPIMVDSKFLPWLASWVNFPLDEALPVNQQRELVRRAIRLVRTRATRAGIEEMVRVLTAAPVRIRERKRPRPAVVGQMVLIGGRDVVERYRQREPTGCYLVEPSERRDTTYFTLTLEPRDRFTKRFGERASQVLQQIARVVSQERPSHVSFTIEFDDRGTGRVGAGLAPPKDAAKPTEPDLPAVMEPEIEEVKPRFAKVDRSKRKRKGADAEDGGTADSAGVADSTKPAAKAEDDKETAAKSGPAPKSKAASARSAKADADDKAKDDAKKPSSRRRSSKAADKKSEDSEKKPTSRRRSRKKK